MPTTAELTLFADYSQIHVLDADSEDADLGEAWTDEAVADGLAVEPDALGIGTAVNVGVAVAVEVLDGRPEDDSAEFDHVVEAGLDASEGRVMILGCSDAEEGAAVFALPAGQVRVRASRANLAAAVAADIDSAKSPATMERVRLQLWPAPPAPPRVVKRWTGV